jgi:hypothetical protein
VISEPGAVGGEGVGDLEELERCPGGVIYRSREEEEGGADGVKKMSTSGEKETMEREFNQAAGNLMWPMLTRTNYQEWASHIQCNLEGMFL